MSQEVRHTDDVVEEPSGAPVAEGVGATDAGTEDSDAESGGSVGYATRFGLGFVVGMFLGAVVGVGLNSLALGVFGGFIVGSILGIYLAERP